MARVIGHPNVALTVTFEMTELEAAAFVDIVGYGIDDFLKVFYEKMGKAYLSKHESGLRSLFKAVWSELPPLLERARTAREAFKS